jgi:molybdenum cofactor cytidylyltransferase
LATGPVTERRLEAIVLAAGLGTRFGGRKLLAPWEGGVLLGAALEAAFAAPVHMVTLVTGADSQLVTTAAHALMERTGQIERLKTVHASDYELGMAASLRTGIEYLPEHADGAYVFLGDMPRIPHALLSDLADALDGYDAVAPTFQGRRGHPVLFARSQFPALAALTGERGGRALLDEMGERLKLVEASDDGILFDVDEQSDLDYRA